MLTPSKCNALRFAVPPAIAALIGSADATLYTRRIANAASLDAAALAAGVADAYRSIAHDLAAGDHRHLVRLWNGIPRIHDRVGDGDRYMAFNAGRFAAMREWYGDAIADRAPAASGVGIDGDDVIVRALAMAVPGRSVQNPRQVPAVRYSPRYGTRPPCFARGTLVDLDGVETLLVSGTAAILGEASMHAGDPEAQLGLTIENLRATAAAAGIATGDAAAAAFTSLRVYLPDDSHAAAVRHALAAAFPNAGPIEVVRAQLCRRELLVEVEGIARIT